jgi:hypothetical protein
MPSINRSISLAITHDRRSLEEGYPKISRLAVLLPIVEDNCVFEHHGRSCNRISTAAPCISETPPQTASGGARLSPVDHDLDGLGGSLI